VLAWSNSETLIRGAIERSAGQPGLGDDPRYQAVRAGLPERAVARLFLNPRFLERLLAADPPPSRPGEAIVRELGRRYLAAVDYAGVALEWRDGLILHLHEAIDPSKLSPALRRWASRPSGTDSLWSRVPDSALAAAAGNLDLALIGQVATRFVP